MYCLWLKVFCLCLVFPPLQKFHSSFLELPENPIDISSLIANSCIARSSHQQQGTFTITGPGGLASRPGDALYFEKMFKGNYEAIFTTY